MRVGSKAGAQAPQRREDRSSGRSLMPAPERRRFATCAGGPLLGERASVRQCFWCVGDGRSGLHETGANFNIRRSNAGGVGHGQLTRLKCRPSASAGLVRRTGACAGAAWTRPVLVLLLGPRRQAAPRAVIFWWPDEVSRPACLTAFSMPGERASVRQCFRCVGGQGQTNA